MQAKELAKEGWEYIDVNHHVEGELTCVALVDGDDEFNEIKVIWQ